MNRAKRKARIRGKISGVSLRPRVVIFRSNKHLYLQAIDDTKGQTIASSSDLKENINLAEDLAKKLLDKKIKKVVFDRGGYKYHGRVKQAAEALRKAGMEF